jgi:hypothetical protein
MNMGAIFIVAHSLGNSFMTNELVEDSTIRLLLFGSPISIIEYLFANIGIAGGSTMHITE